MIKKILLSLLIIIVILLIYPGCLVWTQVGQKPRGERLERIRKSPNYDIERGGFVNATPTVTMTNEDSDSGIVDFLFGKYPDRVPEYALPSVKTDLKHLDKQSDILVWLGHSSVYMQIDGVRYLFDPVLTNSFPVSVMMKPFRGTDIYTPDDIPEIDYLIITHDHWDHLDYYTVTSIQERVKHVVTPLGVGQHLEYWGYPAEKLHELDWGEDWTVNENTTILCLPSRHFSGRMGGHNPTLWASFLIDGKRKVYVSGDGGYDERFKMIGEKYPDIDLVIMENGQYNKSWSQIHLMPEQLAKAIDELHPRYAMTYHNSKYKLSVHTWYDPLEEIYQNAQGKTWNLLTPKIGQTIDMSSPNTDDLWWKD